MTTGDDYRRLAADMSERATRETDPVIRIDLENLSRSYLRLAAQADRNAETDVVYETPPPRSDPSIHQRQQQQQQQQQQPQTKKDNE